MNFDEQTLDKELDKTKSKVFMNKGTAAFLGPVLCSLDFVWDEKVPTAETDGRKVWWNPDFFMSLTAETRATVLVHELWHPALLHGIRRAGRDPEIWNQACDYRINNDLLVSGFSFKGIEWCCLDPSIDDNGRLAEEEIYDLINSGALVPPPPMPGLGQGDWGNGDLREPSKEDAQKVVEMVLRAIHQHKLAGGAGNIPQVIQETLDKFLAPIVPWEKELMQFCTDLVEDGYSWARPNRRYAHRVYLPSVTMEEERLRHIAYYLDVSGSCSNHDVLRFNSEVKFIKEVLRPEKLTLVQFTCSIVHESVFLDEDPFEETVRYGTGGTSLVCVREHMLKHRPTAAIVFSDLDCNPMAKLPFDIPVIWCAVRAAGRKVEFGKLIHMRN